MKMVVDRLLASKAYGERMASEWMDVSRYADSHGLHADGWRSMWPWRDWVIKTFNENLPFDRFVTWQLAGDMLPNATREQKLATAFHRNHPMTAEGGAVDEEWRLEYVFDRLSTTSRAFMGMTLECARCHDHKFDPFSQKEFYQMSAFFNNVKELGMTGDDGNYGPCLPLPSEEIDKQIKGLEKQIADGEKRLELTAKELAETKAFVANLPSSISPNTIKTDLHLQLDKISASGKQKVIDSNPNAKISGNPKLVDGKFGKALWVEKDYDLLHISGIGNFEKTEPFSGSVWVKPAKKGEFQTIMGTSGNKNSFWRGWDLYLDTLNQLSVRLIHNLAHDYVHIKTNVSVPIQEWSHIGFTYDGLGKAKGLKIYINGALAATEIMYDRLTKSIKTVNNASHTPTDRPIQIGKSYRAFTGDNGMYLGAIDNIHLFNRKLSGLEMDAIAGNDSRMQALALSPSKWTEQQQKLLAEYHLLTSNSAYLQQRDQIAELQLKQMQLLDSVVEVMVMEEMPKPRATFVLDRGVYDAPMYKVNPDAPQILGGFPDQYPKNRLGLAMWLLNPKHPLTARVTVNRYWQMYFGKGLVSTPEDFGSQGALPTHPELLDWLATHFIESGWDIKALQKLIVTSATYRQSSRTRKELIETDPVNDLLARGPSYRMPAEMIRDNALAASGLLVKKIGGPSVKPYQPPGLWIDKGNFSFKLLHYNQDEGDDLYRRSLYTFIRRTSPPPSMIAFDATERNTCIVRRQSTNTPMQALILMNDPQYVEAARVLAERMQMKGGTDLKKQIQLGFRLLTSRTPAQEEIDILEKLYQEELAKFQTEPTTATDLLKVGEYKGNEKLDPIKTAALTMVASMIMNHDEAYMKR